MSKNKSHLRWQNIIISQLGHANKLIIALAIGSIGYILNFVKEEEVNLICSQKIAFWLGGLLTLTSIALGLFTVINRLSDFKLTAQIARNRETEKREGIYAARQKSLKKGRLTWKLFTWQVVTFIFGFVLILMIVLIELKM